MFSKSFIVMMLIVAAFAWTAEAHRGRYREEESAGYRGRGSRFDDRRFRGPIRRSLVGGYGGFGGFGGIGGFGIGSVGYALGGVYALPVASVVPVVTTAVVAPVAPVLLG